MLYGLIVVDAPTNAMQIVSAGLFNEISGPRHPNELATNQPGELMWR